MVSINSTYNSKGSALLAKITNQVINKENGARLKNIENIPSQAKTFDLVAINQKFGQDLVEIFSFRDAHGKLIQRIQNTSGTKDSIKISNYKYSGNSASNIRKIDRKTYENGKIIHECFDNIFTFARGLFRNKHFISKTSFNRDIVNDVNVKAEEKSLYGIFQTKTHAKKIIAKANRYADNSVKLKGLQYSGITKDEAKELAKDPYITMRLLPYQDFMSTVKHKVYVDHDLLKAQIKTYRATLKPDTYALANRDSNGAIKILLNKQKPELQSKPKLIESFNHEAQHCRQDIYVEQLDYMHHLPYYSPNLNVRFREMNYGILNDAQSVKYAQTMKTAIENYVDADKDYNAYYNNPCEVDARAAGKKAKDEYTSFADKLHAILPLTNEQLGL